MAKKSLIVTIIIVVTIAAILCAVGWTQRTRERESGHPKVASVVPENTKEVKIIAVQEKIAPPVRKNKEPDKKKSKTKPAATKKRDVPKNSKPIERRPSKKEARLASSPTKQFDKKGRSKLPVSGHLRLSPHVTEIGRSIIAKKGPIPIIQASYDRIGFDSYLKKMKHMGGRLFVGDASQQKILAEIFIERVSGQYEFVKIETREPDHLHTLALFRPREITGEALAYDILSEARQIYGGGDLRCVILLPMDTEAAFLGALKEYLRNSGHTISNFDMVWGHYFQTGSEFGLKLNKARISGTLKTIELDMVLAM